MKTNKHLRAIIFFCWAIFCLSGPGLAAEPLTILATNLPPYSYVEKGELTGFSVEITREILKRIGHPDTIQLVPLTRAETLMLDRDNHVLLSRVRTPEREEKSKWVGPLTAYPIVLYAKKGGHVHITDLESAKYYNVGVSQGSVGHKLLQKHGFQKIDPIPGGRRNARNLISGRIDLWITAKGIGQYGAQREGVDPDLLEVVYAFQPLRWLFIALSRNIPDREITRWQHALEDIKADGSYEELITKYGFED